MQNMSKIPVDVLVLCVVIPAHTQIKGVPFLLVIPLFFYLMLELWHPLTTFSALPDKFGKTRLTFLIRLFLLFIMITAVTIIPTTINIQNRVNTEPDETGFSDAYGDMHDGAIQMEYGLAYLADGKNPYVEGYHDSPLKFFGFSGVERTANPALDYFVYLPGFLLTSFPVYHLFDQLSLTYDQRWIYLFAYLFLVLILPAFAKAPTLKLALLSLIALNPLVTGPVIIGMNDVLLTMTLAFVLLALINKRLFISVLLFGFACTLKQSAWFFAPFYLLALYSALPTENRLKQMATYVLGSGVVFLLIVAPFALWDLSHFVTDVFAYPSGAVEINYPIRGYTIGVLLVGAELIKSPLDSYPFGILQAIFGLPLLAGLLRYQWRHNTVGTMSLCAGLFIFGLGLVSRFFQDNYVGFILTFILLGVVLNLSNDGEAAEAVP